jgi:hypothetical protein
MCARSIVSQMRRSSIAEAGGPRGFDAGKKVKGRKRHIVTDTAGHLLGLDVHPADIQDRDGLRPCGPRSGRYILAPPPVRRRCLSRPQAGDCARRTGTVDH